MSANSRSTTALGTNKQNSLRHRKYAAWLAFMGCGLSGYLAAYQYGVVKNVWEPFFGNGSSVVLNSGLLNPLSHAVGFPVHDAALGAIGYGFETVLAWTGKHPTSNAWFIFIYCGLVLLMGLTSVILVILQAAVFHAFCTLCLTSAAISEVIVLLSVPDLIACTHTFTQAGRRNRPESNDHRH